MGMLDYFDDWQVYTGTAYQKVETKDSQGRISSSYTQVAENVKYARWVGNSRQADIDDQFQNKEVGTILIDPADIGFTPDANTKIDDLFIEGVDNVAGFGDVYKLKYRKEIKS